MEVDNQKRDRAVVIALGAARARELLKGDGAAWIDGGPWNAFSGSPPAWIESEVPDFGMPRPLPRQWRFWRAERSRRPGHATCHPRSLALRRGGTTPPALEEAFETAHPNIDLEITLIPEDQYVVKIDTALAAGSPPDIGFLYEQRWVKTGNILPLGETIAAHEINTDDFNQAVMDGWCFAEGQVYCLGSYSGATVLLYNKALFDAAGAPYPSTTEPMTIDEYADLVMRLGTPSDDIAARIWGGTAEPPHWWMDSRNLFNEDGRQVAGYVNDEATKHAYEVVANLVSDGYAPSGSIMQTLGTEGAEDLFQQGKLAMTIGPRPSFSPWKPLASTLGWRRYRSSRRAIPPSRPSGPMASPSLAAATTRPRRWSSSLSLPPRASACGSR